jgi:hypothetical protein
MQIEAIRNEFKEKIEAELEIGFKTKPIVADTETELEDVFAPLVKTEAIVIDNADVNAHTSSGSSEKD